MDTKTIAKLRSQIVTKMRPYRDSGDYPSEVLREVAELLVRARSYFTNSDGETDWRGSTYAYRMWNKETMSEVRIADEHAARVQGSIRYHVGNVLRERVEPDELRHQGLLATSPRERQSDYQGKIADFLSLFRPGTPLTDVTQVVTLLGAANNAVERIDGKALRKARKAEKSYIASEALALRALLDTLIEDISAEKVR